MKKFKWVSAVTSILMAAALAVTGCAGAAGGSAPSGDGNGGGELNSKKALYRFNNTASFDGNGVVTDFGKNAFLYYPVDLDLNSDTAEMSVNVKYTAIPTGQDCGVGLIDINAGEVDSYALQYYISTKTGVHAQVGGNKGWSTGGSFLFELNRTYIVKATVASKKIKLTVCDAAGTELAVKDAGWDSWIAKNGKVYFAIGARGDGDTACVEYSNIKVTVNGDENVVSTIKDNPSLTELTLSKTSIEVEKDKTAEITYVCKNAAGDDVDVVVDYDNTKFEVDIDSSTKKITVTGKSPSKSTLKVKNSSAESLSVDVEIVVTGFSSTDPYTSLNVYPANAATSAFEDGEFRITFANTPVLNAGGSIKIYDAANSTEVDSIAFADEYQTVGGKDFAAGKNLVRVKDNSVYFTPHHGKLAVNKTYYVAISDGAITGKIGEVDFVGLTNVAANSNWKFTTRATIPSGKSTYVVDNSESATTQDFRSVQGALDAIGSVSNVTINVKPGYYFGICYYSGSANVVIHGDTAKKVLEASDKKSDVIIASGNAQPVTGKKGTANLSNASNQARSTFQWNGNDLTLENISFVCEFKRADYPGAGQTQAEVLAVDGNGNTAAYNCSFFSHQDTIRTINKAWFYKCYAEGDVDFLWQEAKGIVALYEECEIKAQGDEGKEVIIAAPGFTAADTVGKGLVIYNSKIDATAATYLARNPGWTGKVLQVAYIKSTFTSTTGLKDDLWKFGTGNANAWGLKPDGTGIELTEANLANAVSPMHVGWKIDAATLATTGKANPKSTSGLIPEGSEILTKEYNGRNTILNRMYKTSGSGKYVNSDSIWNVSSLASSWGATADTSTLDETPTVEGANGTYSIASKAPAGATQGTSIADGSWADGYFSWIGYKYHGTQYGTTTQSTNSVSITLGGPSVISITGSQHNNNGVMTAKIGETVIATGPTKTTSDTGELPFIANGSKGDVVVITFTGTNYLGSFKVRPKEADDKAEVSSIAIKDPGTVTLEGTTMVADVATTMFGSKAVIWSITNAGSTGASINAETGVLSVTAAGTVSVKATSVLDPTKTATRDVTVTAGALPTASGTYDFRAMAGRAAEGRSDDSAIAWKLYEALRADYGARVYGNDTFISVNVVGNCTLTFVPHSGNDPAGVLKVVDGDNTEIANKTGDELKSEAIIVTYTGSATTLKVTFNQKDNYYYSLTVTNN